MEYHDKKVVSPKSTNHPHYGNGKQLVHSDMYKHEQYIIKDLQDGTYKVICMKSIRQKFLGSETLDEESDRKWLESTGWLDCETASEKENVSRETFRLRESVSRSKRLIWEYARCNKWDFFVTLTLDPEKVDRTDLQGVIKRFGRDMWKVNQSVTGEEWGRQTKIDYVIVPELHDDGKSVHFHGLMRGFHKSDLRTNEHGYLEWKYWRDTFGFCNMQEIRDREKVCSYITKYVTKDLMCTVRKKGLHTFYATHGLEKPVVIWQGYGEWKGEFDYVQEDGYCKTRICSLSELDSCFVPLR